MLNIGICDGNLAHREQLQRVLKALLFEESDVNYLQFSTGSAVLQALQVQHKPLDLLFLEVALPDMNGMVLASMLRRDGYQLDLIFLTELERYVYDGYIYHAFDYLIKPISAKKISVCMRRYVAERLQSSKKYLTITTKGYTERLNLQQVLYFESCQRKITAMLEQHTIEFYQKLGDLYHVVAGAGFLRCHQSYVVNQRQIAALQNQTIVLLNGKEIPVSKRYLAEVKAYMSRPVL